MKPSHFLLFIDPAPVNQDIIHYFSHFKLEIIQITTIESLHSIKELPAAMLINWPLLNNNLSIIRRLYNTYLVPLIIFNDQFNEEICIQALEEGADDFMIKPLNPRELHARISAINRRVTRDKKKNNDGRKALLFTHWKLYPSSRQLFNEEAQELQLSSGEYDLLFAFLQKPQQVLDREFLLHITKNSHLNLFDRRIDVQISRLRQKIEPNTKKPTLIKTIRNGGYIFTASVKTIIENNS